MTIYVQKLSVPAEEWDIDVEPSDTIEAVKQKLMDKEGMGVYEYAKINIFKNGTKLINTSTLSDYSIVKFTHLTSSYNTGFQWMTINEVTSTTASGSGQNSITVSITHSVGGMEPHTGMVGATTFPEIYNVPATGIQIKNLNSGVFTATFSKPIVNALVAFASVGQSGTSVPVQVSRPFTPIWDTSTSYENPVNATQYRQFTGTEGYNIIRIDGTMTEVTFTYTVSENYCTVCFGFVDQNDPNLITCNPVFDKWASPTDTMAYPFSNANPESGCSRYRRLRLLGYI
jgi:hypothetical protein